MKIAVMGANPENPRIAQALGGEGREVVLLDSFEDICRLDGQAGDFAICLAGGGSLSADFIVLTQQPLSTPGDIDGGPPRSLWEPEKPRVLEGTPHKTPVVFLLDYFCESPFAATVQALRDALALARAKRSVYLAARFIRTAGQDTEALYAEVRAAGVTFIKYSSLALAYDDRTDRFDLTATDGVVDYSVTRAVLFADGGRAVGEDFAKAAKALRLHTDAQGYTLEDRHFLSPVLTSRRGVFQIGRDIQADGLNDALAYIDAAIGTFAPGQREDLPQAVVDGERCVLCYSCFRACPHAALRPDTAARKMESMPEACEGCGACESVCPGNAITLGERPPAKQLHEGEAVLYGRLLVLACENGAALAMEGILPGLGELAEEVDIRALPCGGEVGLSDLTGALLLYEKVLVAVCPDDACKHFDGNRRAKRQCARLAEMMDKAGLPKERVRVAQASHAMGAVLRDEILDFMEGGGEA